MANSLEVGINVDGEAGSRIGHGLIQWETEVVTDPEGGGMWVDRYGTTSRNEICPVDHDL